MRYHINVHGEPAICRAKSEATCRAKGADGQHFDSIEQARDAMEQRFSDEYGGSFGDDTAILRRRFKDFPTATDKDLNTLSEYYDTYYSRGELDLPLLTTDLRGSMDYDPYPDFDNSDVEQAMEHGIDEMPNRLPKGYFKQVDAQREQDARRLAEDTYNMFEDKATLARAYGVEERDLKEELAKDYSNILDSRQTKEIDRAFMEKKLDKFYQDYDKPSTTFNGKTPSGEKLSESDSKIVSKYRLHEPLPNLDKAARDLRAVRRDGYAHAYPDTIDNDGEFENARDAEYDGFDLSEASDAYVKDNFPHFYAQRNRLMEEQAQTTTARLVEQMDNQDAIYDLARKHGESNVGGTEEYAHRYMLPTLRARAYPLGRALQAAYENSKLQRLGM